MVNGKAIDWTTFGLFLIGVIGSSEAAILGYIPLQYIPIVTIILGAISQYGSLLRNKEENIQNFFDGEKMGSTPIEEQPVD